MVTLTSILDRIQREPVAPPSGGPASAADPADRELLDAYSRAVIAVVETVGPAVASIGVGNRRSPSGAEGSGSGFVIAPDGYLLTNSHVVAGAERLEAQFTDGTRLAAEVVGADPATDLALIRVGASGLPHAELGTSAALRPGQLVIAMGNPLGFQSTVSTGVVSAVGRALRGVGGRLIENVVQHTAPLNPGNSGGPLLDSRGRVVGINTAIIAMAQGIGFAVPADTVAWVLPQLLSHGRVRRGQLGIAGRTRPLGRTWVRFHHLLHGQAAEVLEVAPDGPGARAGLRPGDLIVGLDQHPVASVDDLHRFLSEWTPGKAVTLTVLRREERLEVQTVPVEAAPEEGEAGR
ncbi:MAG: trypsin-like peptidase domain-containing protein [Candidatus Latescibacterota bacterium]